ncbi:MAG TPA: GNAT family N-acetyltransferase [Nocardioides sp.]|uniref:GNAT family N-acetyltransferase n=1 Tax=Nocardioides sp. TaxID=35761 RepID=UPI002E306479|nr:GNAT family N-acetyltransferase [Nocardioides sp.]HEX3929677.1 GNAT family N-acetyltransferase [Nocardioides sp.]
MERLETTDLVIRPPAVEDAPAAFELLNDPDVMRWNPGRDCPDLLTAEAFCRESADWSDGTHATWHAVDRETSLMVGNVSLFAIDLDDAVAKIGYRTMPAARGRGVARQMVDAVTGWAFERRGLMRVQLEHSVRNLASCRVAEAAGFGYEGTARSAYAVPGGTGRDDCHIHGRLPGDPGL